MLKNINQEYVVEDKKNLSKTFQIFQRDHSHTNVFKELENISSCFLGKLK